jgi:ribosomal protein L31
MFPNVARFEQALKTATQVKTLTKSTQKIDIMQHRSHPIFTDKKLIEIHRSVNNFNTMKHV